MIHCPNCGSTAQFKISTPLYFEDGKWKQQKKCVCGCIVILRYTEEIEKIEYPKDTPLKEWKRKMNGELGIAYREGD